MWAWKYECSFLDVILRANVIRSKSVYLVSTSVNILLTKYIGCCFSSLFDRTKGQMHTSLVTPRIPVLPDWRIRTGFRDARPYTGTLYLIFFFFFFKANWQLWVWPTSYNNSQHHIHLQSPIYNFKTVLLHLQIRARNLHVVNPYKCVGPTVCGSLQMSSSVPTRIKNPC